MNHTDIPERPISPISRMVLMGIGLISFLVIAGQGVGQADDKKYVEGQPRAQSGHTLLHAFHVMGDVQTVSIEPVQVVQSARASSDDAPVAKNETPRATTQHTTAPQHAAVEHTHDHDDHFERQKHQRKHDASERSIPSHAPAHGAKDQRGAM